MVEPRIRDQIGDIKDVVKGVADAQVRETEISAKFRQEIRGQIAQMTTAINSSNLENALQTERIGSLGSKITDIQHTVSEHEKERNMIVGASGIMRQVAFFGWSFIVLATTVAVAVAGWFVTRK